MDKYQKFTNRIESLIKEFNEEIFPKREPGYYSGDFIYPTEIYDKLANWLMKSENVLCLIFGEESIQIKRFRNLRDDLKQEMYVKINQIKGLLEACLDDVKNGFLQGQEFIIANEIFDSVLEEAKFFLEQKNKDIAAILLRIVLEDNLRRISKNEGLQILDSAGKNKKLSILNEELKGKDFYNQTTWRQIQVWTDIGNDAAHGDFEKYNLEQVSGFYEGLVNFITNYFK